MRMLAVYALAFLMMPLAFAVESGKPAPDFTGKTSDGKTVKLSQYKGKNVVVLEWLNYGCPFVKKHYDSKNMQELQAKYTAKGQDVIWLSVISSAPGKQGHSTPKQAEADRKKMGSGATAVILDEKGEIGQAYGAKVTPHMYVIDKEGVLVYQGAIDDKATADVKDIDGARNYVTEALEAIGNKKPVEMAQTTAYGCSVKYN